MSKRQKTVFGSNAEACHVWAHQGQDHGRSSGGNVFFEGRRIYSYGRHYLMAEIHEVNGKRFAIINSRGYSVSTAKHTREVAQALDGLMPYFYGKPSDLKATVEELDSEVGLAIEAGLKRRFFADSRWSTGEDEAQKICGDVGSALDKANRLRDLLSMATLEAPAKLSLLEAHLKKLLKAYNSPKRVAKRREKEAERKAAKEAKRKLREKEHAKALSNFRKGKAFSSYMLDTEYDLLRIRGSRVETSSGALVPLKDAKLLLRAIDKRIDVVGQKIGAYTIDGFGTDGDNGDTFIKIGCHRIMLSEAREVLGAV